MPIQHDDLIPGVTKVRVTRHTRSMASDLEYLDMPSIQVPAIGAVGTVAASYGLRGKRIPVDFAAPGAPDFSPSWSSTARSPSPSRCCWRGAVVSRRTSC